MFLYNNYPDCIKYILFNNVLVVVKTKEIWNLFLFFFQFGLLYFNGFKKHIFSLCYSFQLNYYIVIIIITIIVIIVKYYHNILFKFY